MNINSRHHDTLLAMDTNEHEINAFLQPWENNYKPEDIDLIKKAYHLAEEAHKKQFRESGEPYFAHCLAVASMLAEMRMDCYSICAGILHDVVEDTVIAPHLITGEFPSPIPELIDGVTKITKISFRSDAEKQGENLRRMIIAMSKDIRVIIIKLCDRLHNMRTLGYLPANKRQAISKETLEIFAPLANRLGMMRIRAELEDLAMSYIHPEEYKDLVEKTRHRAPIRESIIDRTRDILLEEFKKDNITAKIEGRTKHIYSIYRKMLRQKITFEEIYDLTAMRVITDTVGQCYGIMGIIHSLWHPIPDRIKDFIATPKENQYQSLHTTVIGLDGEMVEIQIRTPEMHRIAEEGIAAHWKYKEGIHGERDVDKRLHWLRQVIEWIKDIRNPHEFVNALKEDVLADTVFCFTPKGDIFEMPRGATPLDFAYHIHTEVGNACVGARVNKKYVALKTTLNHGDVVEIITSKTAHPSRDWLELVQTTRARNKIKHYLKTREFDNHVRMGRDQLQKALRARGLSLTSDEVNAQLEAILKNCKVNTIEELFFEIGFGSLISQEVALKFIHPSSPQPRKKKARSSKKPGIIVEGIPDPVVRFSNCCNPIAGDPVEGFITRGRGISVHKSDCPALNRLRADSSRIVRVMWDTDNLPGRTVNVLVVARDRTGLLKDIASCISHMNIDVTESHTKTIPQKNRAQIRFTLIIYEIAELTKLLKEIKKIPGVISISRTVRSR
ncbi:MAG TPA: bifunctional (p)ppGpp synthetase/guanosine-3',5'-bis(diphosphate) 3'-pyrophosphohydrolase [Candidatus Sumerlaeota bacterium]|nr:bifunctional (p)ppGpp synthetase/guanosine-3',5'-bis(diphosphate) 3'-pyrophosphohydrolase [Candidatus Sumerlaeota bacterium]HON51505.1 bifunctional (p)ppGpp synthetase/guanosine-3',5'-bis(diphosphate) 3'-pyrophosphohydrolase [Candidatus Sumerlaeota bacterium]HOR65288.1 bifunctional (p)ppGpp synthetase/guanosine-3',5'-bis(diphosphate) 3'-pyrophosphohydrolase [Candidatus Sumerlaeota bacterium]HRR31082.1 bifunctional (p)ppGpp synthetase/guanosine-3',5'-bis(diphosphate) 3'-pyrophosphohydrolase [C